MPRLIFILFCTGMAFSAPSISVVFSTNRIGMDDTLQLKVTCDGDGAPGITSGDFFQISSGQSSQFVIGRNVTRKNEFSYVFKPRRQGACTIEIVLGAYKETFSIEVVAGSVLPKNEPEGAAEPDVFADPFSQLRGRQVTGEDLFMITVPSKKVCYKNEVIFIDTVLYFRVNIGQPSAAKLSPLTGFISEILQKNFPVQQEDVPGRGTYKKIILVRRIASPISAGIKISEGDTFNVPVSAGFFGFAQNAAVSSGTVTIQAEEFPSGQPVNFNGNTGDFSLEVQFDKTKLEARTPLLMTITVSGSGNFKNLALPEFSLPVRKFEVRRSQIKDRYNITDTGYSGEKSAEYYIIPLEKGEYELPGVGFHFFSPQKKQYVIRSSPPVKLSVSEGRKQEVSLVRNSESRTEPGVITRDLRFIKEGKIEQTAGPLLLRPWYYGLMLLSVSLAGMAFFYGRSLKKSANIDKRRRAAYLFKTQRALEILEKKSASLSNRDFFHKLEIINQDFLASLLKLGRGVSVAECERAVAEHGFDHKDFEVFFSGIKICQSYKYAPNKNAVEKQALVQKTRAAVSNFAKESSYST
ncbi:MAG TPA: hypothetical protein DC049_10090 [Spirochaetia bacterium]|nr:hypothetical protein [Spirochaetia bacterium]